MTATLRIVDWNLNGFHTVTDDQLDLLGDLGDLNAEVLTLQEVLPSSHKRVVALGYESAGFALRLPAHPDGPGERRPRFSTAIYVRHCSYATRKPWPALLHPSAPLWPRSRQPSSRSPWSVSPPHPASPGAMAKRARAIASRTGGARRGQPVLAGMDRNGPKYEHPTGVEWWPRDSQALFGDEVAHDLCDVYLDYLAQHPQRRKRIEAAQHRGPLATSYDRGRSRPVPSRYDVIYTSPEFTATRVASRDHVP